MSALLALLLLAAPEPPAGVLHVQQPSRPLTPLRSRQGGPPPVSRLVGTNRAVGEIYILEDPSLVQRVRLGRLDLCPRNDAGFAWAFDARTAADAVFAAIGDRYEQIMFWEDFPTSLCQLGAFAYYLPLQTLVQGLCLPTTPPTGRKLAGFMDMSDAHQYPDDPTGPFSQFYLDVIGQETEHEFGMNLRFLKDGVESTDLIGRQGAHWSFFVHTNGSVMEGNRWRDNGDGSFTAAPPLGGFAPFDLYLWGLLPKEEVPPLFYIDAPVQLDPATEALARVTCGCTDRRVFPTLQQCDRCTGPTFTGKKRTVTIDDVVRVCGERSPSYGSSPHVLTQAWVLVALPDQAVERYDRTESYRQAYSEYFYRNTRFRGRVLTTLDGHDDLAYWEFGAPDDVWTADGSMSDVVLERAPIIPPSDPKIPLGTLTATATAPGATLRAPTNVPYDTKIDALRYDAVQVVMAAPPGAERARFRFTSGGKEYAVTIWLRGDGRMHTYSADLRDAQGWSGMIGGLALEPLGPGTGRFVLDSIKLVAVGTVWKRQEEERSAEGTSIRTLWGDAPSDMFAAGQSKAGEMATLTLSSGRWSREDVIPAVRGAIRALWGFGPNEVYGVGDDGQVVRRIPIGRGNYCWASTLAECGAQGDPTPLRAGTTTLHGLWGRDPDRLYAVGDGGVVLLGSARTNQWTPLATGGSTSLRAIWGSSEKDIWIVGDEGTILHSLDGKTFTRVPSPTGMALRAIHGTSDKHILVVGDGATVLRYDGASFVPQPVPTQASLRGVWARSLDEVYVAGDEGVLLRWEGTPLEERDGTVHPPRWVAHLSGTRHGLRAILGTGERDLFAAGDVALFTHLLRDSKHQDRDRDGFIEAFDNCPDLANPGQEDGNDDGIGNACDDEDGDGVQNGLDNCPFVSNSRQLDGDGNGRGDACDGAAGGCAMGGGARGPWLLLLALALLLAGGHPSSRHRAR